MSTVLLIATICTAGGAVGAAAVSLLAFFRVRRRKRGVPESSQTVTGISTHGGVRAASRDQMVITIRKGDSTVNISGGDNAQILNAVSEVLLQSETPSPAETAIGSEREAES
jgi:hypothetical protein